MSANFGGFQASDFCDGGGGRVLWVLGWEEGLSPPALVVIQEGEQDSSHMVAQLLNLELIFQIVVLH